MITCLEDIAIEIGSAATEGSISKALFKATECGITFNHDTCGISLRGYAEGADAECAAIELAYPIAVAQFWEAVDEADDEGCALWNEWNLMEIEALT